MKKFLKDYLDFKNCNIMTKIQKVQECNIFISSKLYQTELLFVYAYCCAFVCLYIYKYKPVTNRGNGVTQKYFLLYIYGTF